MLMRRYGRYVEQQSKQKNVTGHREGRTKSALFALTIGHLLVQKVQTHSYLNETRNSTKLTDQRGSYAFTCSPFSIYLRHILPTSNVDILVYYLFSTDISEQHV